MTRVGIIGCGNVTLGAHAPALRALDELSVVGIADPNELRRQRVQDFLQLPDSAAYPDHRALLANKPDYVLLAVPPQIRLPIIEDCVRASVPVLTEKPLSTVPLQARAMIDLMREARLPFGMVHNYLFFPEYRLANELNAAGTIGRLRHVSLNFLGMPDNPGAAEYRPGWRHDVMQAGGGVLMDMVHVIYVAEFLMGEPIRTVSAVIDNLDHPNEAVEDFCLIHLYFDSGYVTINLAWGKGMGGVELSGTDGRMMILYENLGTGPFIALDSFTVINGRGTQMFHPRREADNPLTFRLLHADFAEALRLNRPPIAPAEAGLRALTGALAAYESSALGRVVSLPLSPDDPVFQRGVLGLNDWQLPQDSPLVQRGLFGLGRR